MKGLRLLPWLQLARAREPDSVDRYFDCANCMKTTDDMTRRHLGCGYLQPDPRVPVMPWSHMGRRIPADERGPDGREALQICPGYVCDLPEVVEAATAHMFLKNGGLGQFCDDGNGERPTPMLRDAVTVLECEHGQVMDWSAKNPPKKGG